MTVSKFDNAKAFAASAVSDMIAAIGTSARETRLRLSAETSHFRLVWIMLELVSAPAGDTTGEDYVWAHTNDGDLFIGAPPSINLSVPLSQVDSLKAVILTHLDSELATYGKCDALLQSVGTDGTVNPSYTGDTESGYDKIVQQPVVSGV